MLSFTFIKKTFKTWHKLYTRIFISIMLSFSLTMQTTYAAAQATRISAVQDLISKLGMNKKEVSLRQFYIETYNYLPNYVRSEIQAILEIDPEAKLPKVSLQKVKGTNGKEDLQISWANSEAAGSFRVIGEETNQIAKVGKETLSEKDFNGNKFDLLSKTSNGLSDGKMAKWEQQARVIELPNWNTYQKFTTQQKLSYQMAIRSLLLDIEKFQSQTVYKERKTSNFFKAILNRAVAASSSNQCIVAGWPNGEIVSNKCLPPQEVRNKCAGDSKVLCNPAIYGNESQNPSLGCVENNNKNTENCEEKFPLKKNLVENDLQSFVEMQSHLYSAVESTKDACKSANYNYWTDLNLPDANEESKIAQGKNSSTGNNSPMWNACSSLAHRYLKVRNLVMFGCYECGKSIANPSDVLNVQSGNRKQGTEIANNNNNNNNLSSSSAASNTGSADTPSSTASPTGSLTPNSATIPPAGAGGATPGRAELPGDSGGTSNQTATGAKPVVPIDDDPEQRAARKQVLDSAKNYEYKTSPDDKEVVAELTVPVVVKHGDSAPPPPPVECRCGEGWSQNICTPNKDGTTTTVRYVCGSTAVKAQASGGSSTDSSGTIRVTGSAKEGVFTCINPELRPDSKSSGYTDGSSSASKKKSGGWWKRNKGWVLGTILTLSIAGLLTWGIIRWTKRKKPNVQSQNVPLDPSPVPPVPRSDGTN